MCFLSLLSLLTLNILFVVSVNSNEVGNEKRDHIMNYIFDGPTKFKEIAESSGSPITDKVSHHSYYQMYGMFLYAVKVRARQAKQKVKFFEIGDSQTLTTMKIMFI